MAPDGLAIKRDEKIVTGLLQLDNTDIDGAADHTLPVEVKDGFEDVRAYSIGNWVFASLVRLTRFQRGAKHAPQHGVRVLSEHVRVNHEPRLINNERYESSIQLARTGALTRIGRMFPARLIRLRLILQRLCRSCLWLAGQLISGRNCSHFCQLVLLLLML